MLIRSQNKRILINMNNVSSIEVGDNELRIFADDGETIYDLGSYSTREKAMKVLDMIQEAYVNGHIDYQMPEEGERVSVSHIRDRLKQYADKYSDCYKYAGVYVEVIQNMIEQLQEDLEQDEKENGWIPVSERLPEDGIYITTLDGELVGQEEPFTGMCSIENGKWDDEDCVIAWMYLPEPYKED